MIITLCGSARFEAWFHMWNEALSLAGHAVFGLASYPSAHKGEKDWYNEEEKVALDDAHIDKIDVSQAVLILNVFAYMGESTLREYKYARKEQKKIYFLEAWGEGNGIGENHLQNVQDAAARFGCLGRGSPISMCIPHSYPYDLLGDGGPARSRIVSRLGARQVEALGFEWG